jgi:hypothetical protein
MRRHYARNDPHVSEVSDGRQTEPARTAGVRRERVVMKPRIELLTADSSLIDIVLAWHWREWSHEHEDANVDEWRARIRDRTNQDRVPFTLVAHLDAEPVGLTSVGESASGRGRE